MNKKCLVRILVAVALILAQPFEAVSEAPGPSRHNSLARHNSGSDNGLDREYHDLIVQEQQMLEQLYQHVPHEKSESQSSSGTSGDRHRRRVEPILGGSIVAPLVVFEDNYSLKHTYAPPGPMLSGNVYQRIPSLAEMRSREPSNWLVASADRSLPLAKIQGVDTWLRTRPDANGSWLMLLTVGQRFQVLQRQGRWVRIIGPNGVKAWVPLDLVWVE